MKAVTISWVQVVGLKFHQIEINEIVSDGAMLPDALAAVKHNYDFMGQYPVYYSSDIDMDIFQGDYFNSSYHAILNRYRELLFGLKLINACRSGACTVEVLKEYCESFYMPSSVSFFASRFNALTDRAWLLMSEMTHDKVQPTSLCKIVVNIPNNQRLW